MRLGFWAPCDPSYQEDPNKGPMWRVYLLFYVNSLLKSLLTAFNQSKTVPVELHVGYQEDINREH